MTRSINQSADQSTSQPFNRPPFPPPLQVRNTYLDNSIRVIIRRSQDNLQLSPSAARRGESSPPVPPPTPDKELEEREMGVGEKEGMLEPRSGKVPLDQRSTWSTTSDFRSHLVLPPDGQVAHVGEGINFYLRLGALGKWVWG